VRARRHARSLWSTRAGTLQHVDDVFQTHPKKVRLPVLKRWPHGSVVGTTSRRESTAWPSRESAARTCRQTASGPSRESAAGTCRETTAWPSRESAAGTCRQTASGPSGESAARASRESAARTRRQTASGPSRESAARACRKISGPAMSCHIDCSPFRATITEDLSCGLAAALVDRRAWMPQRGGLLDEAASNSRPVPVAFSADCLAHGGAWMASHCARLNKSAGTC
jgi:hypothetical protein